MHDRSRSGDRVLVHPAIYLLWRERNLPKEAVAVTFLVSNVQTEGSAI